MGKKRRSPEMSSGTKDSGNYSQTKMSEMTQATSIVTQATSIVRKGERMDSSKTRQCYNLVTKLLSHRHAWVFKQPVDPRALNIPDYFDIISNPMDLGTVKKKLVSKQYDSTDKFAADVRLTFSNAMLYNPPGNEVHSMANQLNNMFNSDWRVLEGRWRKANSGPEQHTDEVRQVQAVTVTSSVKKKRTGHFEPLPTKPLGNTQLPQKSAQVKRMQGCAWVLFEDLEKSAGKDGCLSASISCIQEQKKISVVQMSERTFHFDGNEAHSYSDASSARNMTSEKEEDNYSYEQQLSPSKALRAAMLRSRFAGTIVKAQQKALLDQGRRLDPVKLQLAKEKLERRQQAEKARIEAQVKAVEAAAQKKAEDEKKMREKQREAARLALQTMKKTVDIDNTDFLRDLENLSKKWQLYSPGPLVVDVIAGDVLQHGLESPLERLGLFMKKDDLEEEGDDWIARTDNGDIEEGEIGWS